MRARFLVDGKADAEERKSPRLEPWPMKYPVIPARRAVARAMEVVEGVGGVVVEESVMLLFFWGGGFVGDF